MNKKFFSAPLIILSGLDDGGAGSVIGKYTGQGTEGLTFDEWMEDIVGSYDSMDDALADLDFNNDGVLDEQDYGYWMENNY